MPDTYQWQRSTIRGVSGWEDMPDPHPRSPVGVSVMALTPGDVWDDGMGNQYRRIRVAAPTEGAS